jgi:hypothetical protein
MEKLKEKLDGLIDKLSADKQKLLRARLSKIVSIYPFNGYEYIFSSLIGLGKITLGDYEKIRKEYTNRNKYLDLYTISSPTGFGITWAQGHLNKLIPALIRPTKELDKEYKVSTDYDFLLPQSDHFIRVELKASRAADKKSEKRLYEKALTFESKLGFDMNFQQIKPRSCDVFVWIAVWKDVIKYWVLSSDEVEKNKYYSKGQHRGNEGEGQLHLNDVNLKDFAKYEIKPEKLKDAIIKAYKRKTKPIT